MSTTARKTSHKGNKSSVDFPDDKHHLVAVPSPSLEEPLSPNAEDSSGVVSFPPKSRIGDQDPLFHPGGEYTSPSPIPSSSSPGSVTLSEPDPQTQPNMVEVRGNSQSFKEKDSTGLDDLALLCLSRPYGEKAKEDRRLPQNKKDEDDFDDDEIPPLLPGDLSTGSSRPSPSSFHGNVKPMVNNLSQVGDRRDLEHLLAVSRSQAQIEVNLATMVQMQEEKLARLAEEVLQHQQSSARNHVKNELGGSPDPRWPSRVHDNVSSPGTSSDASRHSSLHYKDYAQLSTLAEKVTLEDFHAWSDQALKVVEQRKFSSSDAVAALCAVISTPTLKHDGADLSNSTSVEQLLAGLHNSKFVLDNKRDFTSALESWRRGTPVVSISDAKTRLREMRDFVVFVSNILQHPTYLSEDDVLHAFKLMLPVELNTRWKAWADHDPKAASGNVTVSLLMETLSKWQKNDRVFLQGGVSNATTLAGKPVVSNTQYRLNHLAESNNNDARRTTESPPSGQGNETCRQQPRAVGFDTRNYYERDNEDEEDLASFPSSSQSIDWKSLNVLSLTDSVKALLDRLDGSHHAAKGRSVTLAALTSGECYEFRKTGSCRFGQRCRFSHDVPYSSNTMVPTVAVSNQNEGPPRVSLRNNQQQQPPRKCKFCGNVSAICRAYKTCVAQPFHCNTHRDWFSQADFLQSHTGCGPSSSVPVPINSNGIPATLASP